MGPRLRTFDWSTVLTPLVPGSREPGATEDELRALDELWRPIGDADMPWLVEADRGRARGWIVQGRRPPESFVSFLRWSNGGSFRNGERRFDPFFNVPSRARSGVGLPLRETMLGYGVPEMMPHVLPFAFDGGGVMAAFDMREEAVGGEYPIVAFEASSPRWSESVRIAASFEEFCCATTRY